MKNGKYEFDASGLFSNLPDALNALHELTVVIAELLYTDIAAEDDETLTVAEIIDPELLEAVETAASAMHYHSCLEARQNGSVRPDGSIDVTRGKAHGPDKIVADDSVEVKEEDLIPLNESPSEVPESMRHFLSGLLDQKGF